MTIASLIDKQDNFEIIRDQIAAILVIEVASQMALATAASKDPDDWKLRIFTERSNPWEQLLNEQIDVSPIINIWFDNSNFPQNGSNVKDRQKTEGTFNIDCYGYGVSEDLPLGGHTPGDQESAFEVQKAIRLVRNILMAAEYTYLGLRGTVWQRWPQTINIFQPEINSDQIQKMTGARIALSVTFNEFSPQVVAETLEFLSIAVKRVEDGEVVINADYDYTI